MAIKKYSKVKFTLRKELIIILAAIVVLVVATILLNLPNEEEKFLEKWNNAGAQISENRLYEEVTIDELNQILASKKADETTFVFFATPENADSVTYFSQVVNHANTHDVSKVYLVDSAFAIGTREEGNDLDKQLSEIEAKFKVDEDATFKLDSVPNIWVFKGDVLVETVDDYEEADNKWNAALAQLFTYAYKEKQ